MSAKTRHPRIKARRDYRDRISGELVHVTGWALVDGEHWCRTRSDRPRSWTGDTLGMLVHPDRLVAA